MATNVDPMGWVHVPTMRGC